MNTQLVAFNLALSRIAAIGYAKSITAFNLVGAPLPLHHSSFVMKGETAEPRPKPARQHRTNRIDYTPERRAQRLASRLKYNATYKARRTELRHAAARLQQMALALEQES